jgi:hypothetical protein
VNEYTVIKSGREWSLLDPAGVAIDAFKTKADALNRAAELNATPHVVRESASKWSVVVGSEIVDTLKTKKAADAAAALYEIPANDELAVEDEPDENVEIVPPAGPVATLDEIESMDRVARLKLAKAEHEALVVWKQSGGEGDRPSTPILDYFADPASVERRHSGKKNGGTRSQGLSDEHGAKFDEIVREHRAANTAWKKIAEKLTAEGIPTVSGLAKWGPNMTRRVSRQRGVVES